jgi:hypothetical protein
MGIEDVEGEMIVCKSDRVMNNKVGRRIYSIKRRLMKL